MSTYKSSEQIRQSFLDFFREKGHEIVPSAPLVPQNDPTLLFTNAGMNQFKDVFLGIGTRPYKRAANTQKCLRVSGKHNDLEEVGPDTYHHTFFEMLGNWSFGDYFKREAIRWAWELLVERWGLDPDRLYATVHEGDEALGLEPDVEAAELWKSETSIDPSHIKFCSTKDNFWMMGDTGPCGPCSEIHIDLRPDEERRRVPGIELVNAGDPRVIEIWNLVFIQYNALPDGRLEPLKAKHVDTGMGLERIVAVLQGKTSNYDTDLFAPILQRAAELSPRDEVRGYDDIRVADERERERIRVALRVVADHIRAIAFAIADGVVPGNTGRGYVIRRILRRAVRYGYQTLGFREPFLHRLVEPLAHKMGRVFPEIERHRAYVERVIKAEEESFLATLGTGLAFFERLLPYLKAAAEGRPIEAIRADLVRDSQALDLLQKAYVDTSDREAIVEAFLKSAAEKNVPGEVAFLLHDTYGFPIDLTQLMAREEGLGVDMARYEELMQRQRERARAASTFGAAVLTADEEEAGWKRVSEGEDSVFVGYDTTRVEDARIRAVRTIQTPEGPRHELVLDQTPFYAESGGQVGDTGVLRVGDEEIRVLDTQKLGGHIVHYVDRLPKELDAPVEAIVDAARRKRIEKHHTATHLLHAALREILGTHVQQKGSLVAPDRLRFDFSHFERVTPELLRQIEARVNEVIQRNVPRIEEREVPYEEAIARGAMALFGEKYGDRVRVITFDPNFSMELCGGTHVAATGELGVFRIISEGSVASGIRRVEALAGQDALDWINRQLTELEQARTQFKSLQRPLDEEIAALLEEQRRLEKELAALRREQQKARLAALVEQAHRVNGLRVVTGQLEALSMDELRELAQALRDQLGREGVAVLGTTDPEKQKVYLAAAVTDDVVARGLEAGRLVGQVARIVGGGGGGRPTLATAGGRQPEKLREALEAVPRLVQQMVG
ncbi:alanyl-tRNA synthetase [Rhodothermus marinus SG0.5JP17-172]|uniref:alanine--tRNA ligase n=1 Tax=Rhodothermus marinus TaxID=29549 RepID=UPI000223DC4A|nr:alanine--tRNA ligase [Rhodothermus marinus]AEN73159.1 alanyl-tRNA synthetase [Rhodothermus marinus SG0.5JP17-172]